MWRGADMIQRNGYSAHEMPELAVKTKMTPSSSSSTLSGMSHHFFSWRANLQNSLRSDHMAQTQFTDFSAVVSIQKTSQFASPLSGLKRFLPQKPLNLNSCK